MTLEIDQAKKLLSGIMPSAETVNSNEMMTAMIFLELQRLTQEIRKMRAAIEKEPGL